MGLLTTPGDERRDRERLARNERTSRKAQQEPRDRPRKQVCYQPESTDPNTAWCWDCGICYRNQYDIPDQNTAKRLANEHAAKHGVKAVKHGITRVKD